MKILFRFTLMLAAAAVGLGIGLVFRARHVSAPRPKAVVSIPTPKPLASSFRDSNRAAAIPFEANASIGAKLERDLAGASGVTRWLLWIDALERARPNDFKPLLKLAQGNPALTRLVQSRWAEVAPRQLFELILAAGPESRGRPGAELAHVLFEEWPRRDPDGVIAAVNEVGRTRLHHEWRWTIAYSIIETDIERGLRLLVDWHADDIGFGSRGIAAVEKWTRANPQHAAEFLLQQPGTYSFQSALEALGREWARIDPAAALTFASGQPGNGASRLAASVLNSWAEQNLTGVADWLARADDATRRRLSGTFVEAWAKQDAAAALTWCEANLTGSTLAHAVAGALQGVAEKNAAAAAALVLDIEPSPARTEAARAVAEKWFPQLASGKIVPPETIAWLTSLDADALRSVLDRVTWSWATSDPKSMAAFLTRAGRENVPNHAYTVVGREFARREPLAALEWSSRLPGEPGLSAGGAAFTEWQGSQPHAALQWLNELPATDPRRGPYLEASLRNLVYHPQAAEQFAAMSPPEREAARAVVTRMDLPEARRTQLLQMLKTP